MEKDFDNIKTFPANTAIIKQGEEGQSAYIIEKGHVEILIEKENGLVQSLGTRGPGSLIGEMAIVDDNLRTATVKTIEECEVLLIDRTDFNKRLESADPVIQMFMKVILSRYRDVVARSQIFKHSGDAPALEQQEKKLVKETNAVEKIKLANELSNAFENDHIQLHYQPIINLKTGNIIGFESLMRWEHPEKGFISPGLFVPVAEENGLITELSKLAVEKSCATLRNVETSFDLNQKLFVSVNFASTDFMEPEFQDHLQENLKKNALSPEQLHIEITERLLMDNPDNASKVLEKCRDAGMCVSIDDFGTGYSSLSYLHYFPIDILKIDRVFINNMLKDDSALELVKSVLSLAHNMGMKVIAEGIEEKHQADMLAHLGCDHVQGYYLAKPMDEDNLKEFVSEALKIHKI
ncbi:MAG: EAL domain-containing protein [Alphaproteobacteria bacterium]|nr:EAL domain-containing protein [Alphaproteobacteria bacterium]